MDQPSEEYEHIPWSELTAVADTGHARMLYTVAGVVAALVIGVVVARSFGGSGAAVAEPLPSVPEASPATVPLVTETQAVPPDTTAVLFSETDLLAVLPDEGARVAVVRAEWFVTDYFTADLDPLGSSEVWRAFSADADVPLLPQDSVGPGVSFVEWSRAFEVRPLASGLYRVGVAFRTIGANSEGKFRRLPVRAVDIVVAVAADAASSVVELPLPRPLPEGTTYPAWPVAAGGVDAAASAAALGQLAPWGLAAEVVGGVRSAHGWRVVVAATDEVGNRWPLAVWLDDSGALDVPPWGNG